MSNRRRDIPELNDLLVDRVCADSVSLIESAIRRIEQNSVRGAEVWFHRPQDVCELLADRLSCAEWCLKEDVSFESYQAILEYMDIRGPDGTGS